MQSKPTAANHPVFIIGLPRSGSTLWSNVLGAHPEAVAFADMHFLSIWHRDIRYVLKHISGDLLEEKNVQKLVAALLSKKPVAGLTHGIWYWKQIQEYRKNGLEESLFNRIIACDDRNIGAIFKIIIEETTRCMDGSRAVVKFPVYPPYLRRLVRWWPESKIVFITRDPRSLAASKSNDPHGVASAITHYPWMKSFLPFLGKYFAVFQYIWTSYLHSRFDGMPNYRLFKYEDLMYNPENTIKELCEFCELDYSQSMLYPTAGQASSVTGKKASGFDPSRVEGWKKMLSPRESRFIEFITKSSMKRFGYQPGSST